MGLDMLANAMNRGCKAAGLSVERASGATVENVHGPLGVNEVSQPLEPAAHDFSHRRASLGLGLESTL